MTCFCFKSRATQAFAERKKFAVTYPIRKGSSEWHALTHIIFRCMHIHTHKRPESKHLRMCTSLLNRLITERTQISLCAIKLADTDFLHWPIQLTYNITQKVPTIYSIKITIKNLRYFADIIHFEKVIICSLVQLSNF